MALQQQLIKETQEDNEPSISSQMVSFLWGDASGSGQTIEKWLASVRRRSGNFRPSGFPNRQQSNGVVQTRELDDSVKVDITPQSIELSLWERLGKAARLDIESSDFSWHALSSLHHTEHNSSTENSGDEMSKSLEMTVNSGGVVFFALFNTSNNNNCSPNEAAAVIKIASSRMATQSERLGYEFAKWLGVRTPQARVVHSTGPEWQQIKDATQKARLSSISSGDEACEITCSELLEALELGRCLFLMDYMHGSPLLESSNAFQSREVAANTAAALGRVLMLDLVIRNEDRLQCRRLGWRGNNANLLLVDKVVSANIDELDEASSTARNYMPAVTRLLQKEKRPSFTTGSSDSHKECSSKNAGELVVVNKNKLPVSFRNETSAADCHVVAIDSGVPRRPPGGKRAKDQERYPKLVELLLNSAEYSSTLLYEISGGKLGSPRHGENGATDRSFSFNRTDMASNVHEFRASFRSALGDLQSIHLFLLTLYQKLDGLIRIFHSIISRNSGEVERDDSGNFDSPSSSGNYFNSPSPLLKYHVSTEIQTGTSEAEIPKNTKSSPPGSRGSLESVSPISREKWNGRYFKGSGEHSRSLRLTIKLRDFNKFAKIDAETSKELEQWNELVRTDVIKLCQEKNFNTGFFEGSDNNLAVDAYELKVRLEHVLERIALISDAASTERPSQVTDSLYVGGALAARSMHTLQHLGITDILCLCSNEIGQSDSQYPDLFNYKNFLISDEEDSNISDIFEEATDYISLVENQGGKVLVHCFEGKSRSATVVLSYLMLKNGYTLSESWNMLKKVHRRAQPNDGFAKVMLDLDKKLHGNVSMDWQHKRPVMKVCPICGKNAGLSTSSLKLHLQKHHKRVSSGSADSAMTVEIQRALEALKIGRGSSVSPTAKSHSFTYEKY